MVKILFFGPYSPPVTGQSIAFRKVVDSFSSNDYRLVDTTKFQFKAANTINSVVSSLFFLLFTPDIDRVYFTCSRSIMGSIREIPLLLIAGLKRKRIINHLHGGDFRSFWNKANVIYKPILGWAYSYVNTSIVLTPAMVHEFEPFSSMKKAVVPNFYSKDLDRYQDGLKQESTIIFFSNIMISKGILDFFEAVKIVCEHQEGVQIIVAGRFMGDNFKNMKETKKLVMDFINSNENLDIQLITNVDVEKRLELLAQSSIFVLPSYSEGFPLTILEAMRCGNAIVATNCNYLSDIIGKNNGILVEPRNANSLADAVMVYLDNKELLKQTAATNIKEARMKYCESRYIKSVRAIIDNR